MAPLPALPNPPFAVKVVAMTVLEMVGAGVATTPELALLYNVELVTIVTELDERGPDAPAPSAPLAPEPPEPSCAAYVKR